MCEHTDGKPRKRGQVVLVASVQQVEPLQIEAFKMYIYISSDSVYEAFAEALR